MRSLIPTKNSPISLLSLSLVTTFFLSCIPTPEVLAQRKSETTRTPFKATNETLATKPSSDKEEMGMEAWLNQERIVFLSQEIDPDIAEAIIARLLYLDHKSPGKDIHLYINSPGGEINAGLAIYDTIRSLKSDVVTIGLGEVSSMASLLLAAGTKGKRVALPSVRVMIHQPWGSGIGGQASDIAITAREILYSRTFLNRLLSDLTGQPLKRIEVDTERDFYMSAQEAKGYGIVDQVIRQAPTGSRPLSN